MKQPKVLVVSNNCFSKSNSNGRTLGALFYGWPRECLAQFCIIAKDPDWELCDNYYCLEDKKVLNAFLRLKKADGRQLVHTNACKKEIIDTVRPKIGSKTMLKVLSRQLVWSGYRWNSDSFKKWVENFGPELVLIQLGDSSFMLKIAEYLSIENRIPLVVFNTEGYFFYSHNFLNKHWSDFITFPIFHAQYSSCVKSIMNRASHVIYLNNKLQRDYSKVFKHQSSVIFSGSDVEFCPKQLDPSNVRFSYLGNLGIDRDSALVEVGEVLYSINSKYKVDVYGNATSEVADRLDKAVGVDFHGMIPYNDVKNVIKNSDVLFSVETEKGNKEHFLMYGFSTKIADSLASGKCFVLFSPYDIASAQYIRETKSGWYAQTKDELKLQILDIIYNESHRREVIANAHKLAIENHSLTNNSERFQKILISQIQKNNEN